MKSNDTLRKAIIKSALEGKLCSHSNENGESFFAELLKAGGRQHVFSKIIKDGDKYFEIIGKEKKEITEDIPFNAPNNWVWCRFEDICDFCIGKTPERKTSSYWDSPDVPWVSITDMKDNSHISKTKESISRKAKEDCFSFEPFEPGSMLMSFKLTIGKTSIVDMPCYCNEAIMKFEPFVKNDTFRAFLFMFIGFLSREIRVTDAIKGSTLNKKKIAKMLIPVPPLVEQQETIDKMHRIEPLIREYEELERERVDLDVKLPDILKKSILKYVMEGNVIKVHSSEENALELYSRIKLSKEAIRTSEIKPIAPFYNDLTNSITCDLRDIAMVFGGKRVPKNMSWQDEPTEHRYIRVTDMKNQTVINESPKYISNQVYDVISKYTVNKGDVYITVAGTIGEAGTIPEDCDGANLTENANKIILPKEVDPVWFAYQLNSDFIQSQIADLKTQVAQPKLAIKRIESLRIRIIPYERQIREIEYIKNSYYQINKLLSI